MSANVRFDGWYPLFYLTKPGRREYRIGVALSEDALFQMVRTNTEFDTERLGNETFSEKYQFYMQGNLLCLIYELGHKDGDCRTGMRKYEFLSPEPD